MSSIEFSGEQLEIVRFCAVECEMQRSGEASVSDMVLAWQYALAAEQDWSHPNVDHIVDLGRLVEPSKNKRGYRRVGVCVGWDVKLDWRKVDNAMGDLLEAHDQSPDEWFREYEDIHPFVDGNGRTGQILFNWLNGSLSKPQWAPNFWNDERRVEGRGA